MSKKQYKYLVVYKLWNKTQDNFTIETTTLSIFKEINSKQEISKVTLIHVDAIISFEAVFEYKEKNKLPENIPNS